jgi:polyisoprenoid-binding protein YceI
MTRKSLYALAATALAVAATAGAQGLQMTIRPDSKLTLEGSSNVHDWACRSSAFVATVDVDTAFTSHPLNEVTRPIGKVAVTIPVKTLKCGHGKMDDNMYKALKAEQFPDIKYALSTYTIDREHATADSFTARTIGELTVSGQTIKVEIPVNVVRLPDGTARGEGTVSLLMTDFGIKPPVALLGTLRTKNEISIAFNVLLDTGTVIALSQPQRDVP